MEGHRRIPTCKSKGNDQNRTFALAALLRWHLVNVVTVCLRNALCYVTHTVCSCLPTIEWLRRGGRKKKKGKKREGGVNWELKLDPARRGTDEKGVVKLFYMSQRFAPQRLTQEYEVSRRQADYWTWAKHSTPRKDPVSVSSSSFMHAAAVAAAGWTYSQPTTRRQSLHIHAPFLYRRRYVLLPQGRSSYTHMKRDPEFTLQSLPPAKTYAQF